MRGLGGWFLRLVMVGYSFRVLNVYDGSWISFVVAVFFNRFVRYFLYYNISFFFTKNIFIMKQKFTNVQ